MQGWVGSSGENYRLAGVEDRCGFETRGFPRPHITGPRVYDPAAGCNEGRHVYRYSICTWKQAGLPAVCWKRSWPKPAASPARESGGGRSVLTSDMATRAWYGRYRGTA